MATHNTKTLSQARHDGLQFRAHIERLAEVCWEMSRAWMRSEEGTSTATDPRIPRKWEMAGEAERIATHAAVLNWWRGIEEPAEAPAINHMCRAAVLEYKAQLAPTISGSE